MDPRDALHYLASHGTVSDPDCAFRLSVGLDDLLARLRQETFPFLRSGGAELRFFEAPYGRGKTHLLRAIEAVARKQGFVTAFVSCDTNNRPFVSFNETYRQVVASLSSPKAASLDKKRGPENLILEPFRGRPIREMISELATVRESSLLARDFRNLVYAYGKRLCDVQGKDPLRDDLAKLLRAHPADRIRLTDLYRADRSLPRPLGKLSRRNAGAWLRSICTLPSVLGYPGLMVLFDETEHAHPAGPSVRSQFANLRNIVDHLAAGDFSGCAIFYAVVDNFLDVARTHLEALSQRIERVPIELNGRRCPNPRAVWCQIDEVTRPGPGDEEFYVMLLDRLLKLGAECGLPEGKLNQVRRERLLGVGDYADRRIDPSAVRDFVRETAECILRTGGA